MNAVIQPKKATSLLVVSFVFACIAFSPAAQAVSPPPDGGYPGGTTAEGENALLNLTTGQFNTGVGWLSLNSLTTGNVNTAVGAGTLFFNEADGNTAVGAGALLFNTTGDGNTANGAFALFNNREGVGNTANGSGALFFNERGAGNTAVGAGALHRNGPSSASSLNTAVGLDALSENTEGSGNTAVGAGTTASQDAPPPTLGRNDTGSRNTAIGAGALAVNTTGSGNIAVGFLAGENVVGDNNIYIGADAGPTPNPTPSPSGTPPPVAESNTIRIGKTPFQNRTFIAGIYGQPPGANTLPVVCADDGKLTANASSRRFKHDIKPMDNASEAILALKPVSFRYNNDSTDTPWFGLIAEDVAEINPDLIARDKEGKPFGVRYDQVNVMLLNEFLKARRQIDVQQKQIDALTAAVQKVSAQLELSKPAPQTVLNNP
jgi:Chaperone of endosialidase